MAREEKKIEKEEAGIEAARADTAVMPEVAAAGSVSLSQDTILDFVASGKLTESALRKLQVLIVSQLATIDASILATAPM